MSESVIVGQSERVSCALAAGAGAGVAGGAGREVAGGNFSAGIVNAAAGVFSNGTAGPAAVAFCLSAVSLPLGCAVPADGAGESTLPRMIGNPSFPLPIMTTLEFVDGDRWSVGSIPRHRRQHLW